MNYEYNFFKNQVWSYFEYKPHPTFPSWILGKKYAAYTCVNTLICTVVFWFCNIVYSDYGGDFQLWGYNENVIISVGAGILLDVVPNLSLSQWPRGLRHEPSSPAVTLGYWFEIPLNAWMSVCVCSAFMLPCVDSGLAMCWSPAQGVLPTVCKVRISKLINSEWAQTKGPNPWR
jgi:hypothetical protein